MAGQSHIYAGVAGYVGRPEEKGKIGVFRRAAAGGEWQHVLTDLETHALLVHPTDSNVVLAGTVDGVWRSTDRGATFQRASFPDKGKQVWSFLVEFKGCQAHLCWRVARRCLSQRRSGRELAAAARSGHQGPRHRSLRRARHAHGAAPQSDPTRSTPRWR